MRLKWGRSSATRPETALRRRLIQVHAIRIAARGAPGAPGHQVCGGVADRINENDPPERAVHSYRVRYA